MTTSADKENAVQQVRRLNRTHVKGHRKIDEHTAEQICTTCREVWPCAFRILAGFRLAALRLAEEEQEQKDE